MAPDLAPQWPLQVQVETPLVEVISQASGIGAVESARIEGFSWADGFSASLEPWGYSGRPSLGSMPCIDLPDVDSSAVVLPVVVEGQESPPGDDDALEAVEAVLPRRAQIPFGYPPTTPPPSTPVVEGRYAAAAIAVADIGSPDVGSPDVGSPDLGSPDAMATQAAWLAAACGSSSAEASPCTKTAVATRTDAAASAPLPAPEPMPQQATLAAAVARVAVARVAVTLAGLESPSHSGPPSRMSASSEEGGVLSDSDSGDATDPLAALPGPPAKSPVRRLQFSRPVSSADRFQISEADVAASMVWGPAHASTSRDSIASTRAALALERASQAANRAAVDRAAPPRSRNTGSGFISTGGLGGFISDGSSSDDIEAVASSSEDSPPDPHCSDAPSSAQVTSAVCSATPTASPSRERAPPLTSLEGQQVAPLASSSDAIHRCRAALSAVRDAAASPPSRSSNAVDRSSSPSRAPPANPSLRMTKDGLVVVDQPLPRGVTPTSAQDRLDRARAAASTPTLQSPTSEIASYGHKEDVLRI